MSSSSLLEWQANHDFIPLSQIDTDRSDLYLIANLESDNSVKEGIPETDDNDDDKTVLDSSLPWEDMICSQATVGSIPPIKLEGEDLVPTISSNPFSRGISTQSYLLDNLTSYMLENEQFPPCSSNTGSHSYITRKRSLRDSQFVEATTSKRLRREDSFLSHSRIAPLMIKPDPDAMPLYPSVSFRHMQPISENQDLSLSNNVLALSQGDADGSLQLVLDRGAPNLLPALALQRCFYKLPKQYNLAQRLQQRNRLIPTLRQVRKLCGYLEFVQVNALTEVCNPDSVAHKAVYNVLSAVSGARSLTQRSSKKWMTALYDVIPPHNVRDHKAERITRQATSLLLATSILAHHKGLDLPLPEHVYVTNMSMYRIYMEKFLVQNQGFLADGRKTAIREALPRLFFFFIELFTILPLKGNLEVCLLLLSFLESEGKHHQRGGTNADVTYKFYREFLEYIDVSVMPQLRRN